MGFNSAFKGLMFHLALTCTETRMRVSRPVGRIRQGNISVGERK